MKNITLTILTVFCIILFSCETEEFFSETPVSPQNQDINTDLDVESADNPEESPDEPFIYKVAEYDAVNADRCADDFPDFNFWWDDRSVPFKEQFFASSGETGLKYTKYSDGSVNISGTTFGTSLECKVTVDLWMINKRNWEEWKAVDGEFKDSGCSGAVPEDLSFYQIDGDRSFIETEGSECFGSGRYRLTRRLNADGTLAPNFGVGVGPGGALWDRTEGALGLATWASIVDIDTGEHLWGIDFNFLLENKLQIVRECFVENADRCDENMPDFNFWWDDRSVPFRDQFFASSGDTEETGLKYTEYSDGSVNLTGTTFGTSLDCEIIVNFWFQNKKTWEEWQAVDGEFKDAGCSGAVPEDLVFYQIDPERSFIETTGGECFGEGTYRLVRRLNADGTFAPNFGVGVGPGGALWDTEVGAQGLATWASIVDVETGDHLWGVDFNFLIPCGDQDLEECDDL